MHLTFGLTHVSLYIDDESQEANSVFMTIIVGCIPSVFYDLLFCSPRIRRPVVMSYLIMRSFIMHDLMRGDIGAGAEFAVVVRVMVGGTFTGGGEWD